MKIDCQQNPKPVFNAKLIGVAETCLNKQKQVIQLYALENKDKKAIQKYISNLDLKKLYPTEPDYSGFTTWKYLIEKAGNLVGIKDVVLAVHDDKPCGIMASRSTTFNYHLAYLAKWRTMPNVDTNFVGKILMRCYLGYAKKSGKEYATVAAAQCAPRGKRSRDFYKNLGFQEEEYCRFCLPNSDLQQKIAQLENHFNYIQIDKAPSLPIKECCCLKTPFNLIRKVLNFFKSKSNE